MMQIKIVEKQEQAKLKIRWKKTEKIGAEMEIKRSLEQKVGSLKR
jgi:hypothetical protein